MSAYSFMSRKIWRKFSTLCQIILVVVFCFGFESGQADERRPVYIIAHMANSIYELEEHLARGANAIEADLTFYSNGSVKHIFHGYPCDCYRVCDEKENFAKYLNHVRDFVNPEHEKYKKSLTLLFLDLKLSDVSRSDKFKAGEEIAKYLITHLWSNDLSDPHLYVLLSIQHVTDAETIRGVRDTFTKSNRAAALHKLGFDVGMNDDLNTIRRMWTKLGVNENRWQGDGITNCLRSFRDDTRLRHAIRNRDSGTGFIDKVYDWTVDTTAQMRRSLRAGVDGILTNFPERLVSVLREKEFKEKYRLATRGDNPFSKVKTPPFQSIVPARNMNAYVATLREVTVALMGYMWDFYKLRLQRPATLFPLMQEILSRATPLVRQYSSTLKKLSRMTEHTLRQYQ